MPLITTAHRQLALGRYLGCRYLGEARSTVLSSSTALWSAATPHAAGGGATVAEAEEAEVPITQVLGRATLTVVTEEELSNNVITALCFFIPRYGPSSLGPLRPLQ